VNRIHVQSISKYPLIRVILGILTVALIAGAVAFELLPEEVAKLYVVPTLVAALFARIAQTSIYKKY
jgi:hypothetical protein